MIDPRETLERLTRWREQDPWKSDVYVSMGDLQADVSTLLSILEWRPISEAPKDGTEFLMLLSNGWHTIAAYPVGVKRYAWWRVQIKVDVPVVETHGSIAEGRLVATHFLPLPAAPTEAQP